MSCHGVLDKFLPPSVQGKRFASNCFRQQQSNSSLPCNMEGIASDDAGLAGVLARDHFFKGLRSQNVLPQAASAMSRHWLQCAMHGH